MIKSIRIYIMSMLFLTVGCDNGKLKENNVSLNKGEAKDFIERVKGELIFVQGGEFEMGDFGEMKQGVQLDPNPDSKPLHKVSLSSFSISKYKITNGEYKFYKEYNKLPDRPVKKTLVGKWNEYNKTPNTPALIDWHEADNYCSWLSSITGLEFSLPSEAQWEYSARSRGEFVQLATNNGKAEIDNFLRSDERGINLASSTDRLRFSEESGTSLDYSTRMPVDAFPPNPLGVYDMTANGFEWVRDWYDPDYYSHSPKKNPQGPENPTFKDKSGNFVKVARSSPEYNGIIGSVVGRRYDDPKLSNKLLPSSYTARCVVNSELPIK
ncbi:SUMF1/EgtB/PvdO family nonheme iron enzyme [Enterobacter sp. CFBP8995]|nr:SUMF1/EgtB/PvdO family nonheme iron enzyme [Enterobacter sp. CFBP8995]